MTNGDFIGLNRATDGCTQTYTFRKIKDDITYLSSQKMSLRAIARERFGGRVTHGVVQRILKGEEPTKIKVRAALGLPPLAAVVPCPSCGDVHTLGDICPREAAVDVIVRVGDAPREVKVKTVRARRGAPRPRPSYKRMYLELLEKYNAIIKTYATMEE